MFFGYVFFTPHCNRMLLGNLIWPFSESWVFYPPGTGEAGCVLLMEVVAPRTNILSHFVIVSKATDLFLEPTGKLPVCLLNLSRKRLYFCADILISSVFLTGNQQQPSGTTQGTLYV